MNSKGVERELTACFTLLAITVVAPSAKLILANMNSVKCVVKIR